MDTDFSLIARRRNCPQAASILEPFRLLVWTLTPALRRTSRKRSRDSSVGSSHGRPATALYGMIFTKAARLPKKRANARALSGESLRFPSNTYSKVRRRPDVSQYRSAAARIASMPIDLLTGTSFVRSRSSAAWMDTAR